MTTLKQVKQKIGAIKKLGQVTSAMEAVAAAKMRKTQDRAAHLRSYMQVAAQLIASISSRLQEDDISSWRQTKKAGRVGIVLITADRGLAGALNSNIIRALRASLRERNLSREDAVMFAVGKRGAEFFSRRGWEVALRKERWGGVVPIEDIRSLAEALLLRWQEGAVKEVEVWYSYLRSTFEQQARCLPLLPLSADALRQAADSIQHSHSQAKVPLRGDTEPKAVGSFLFAPSAEAVWRTLVPLALSALLAHAVAESAASEQAARMVAMKNATDRGEEMVEQLTLSFNKIRQASITREISEIVSSIEAMQ
ncbi:ATP synthase F1 subunit gamma [Candidatus Parcubacteria bacterium]|nr:MAG: ATP synthase F1 subunit gamma [Candidatus Parcubacteria bacterium]